jgi:glutamine synthetase
MKCKDANEVLKVVREKKVKFVQLWFTDILGFLKTVSITIRELPEALESGTGFDGSSIEGFARIEESDMIAKPDPTTFQILPWRPSRQVVGRMFCDILTPEGTPYEGDPRYILKRNLEKAKKKGFICYLGPELEYFYFKNAKGIELLDRAGYFDLTPADMAKDLRSKTVTTLEEMGIPMECSHHEVAPSQHELDFKFQEALITADNVITYRLVTKEVARRQGVYATFMPKPISGINGSGMHVHQSLFKGKRNAFFNPKDKYHLSTIGKKFLAGLLRHSREITSITNQWVNSYKRLIPGYEAPVYICWGQRNRSALVRVPHYKPGKEMATRLELRSPDPACNPYLAFSVMLAAGLKGIEKNYKLMPSVERDVYDMNSAERDNLGIKSLPEDLHEAITETEKSSLIKEALGKHIFQQFIANKKIQWDEYCRQVTQYELKRYLPLL